MPSNLSSQCSNPGAASNWPLRTSSVFGFQAMTAFARAPPAEVPTLMMLASAALASFVDREIALHEPARGLFDEPLHRNRRCAFLVRSPRRMKLQGSRAPARPYRPARSRAVTELFAMPLAAIHASIRALPKSLGQRIGQHTRKTRGRSFSQARETRKVFACGRKGAW